MASDHNDQRAQNFTSGAILDKHLNKVIIPSGKNAELLEKVREIVAAGVKDIYNDASERKYQKIVNLIMKRMGAKLEDTGISSDLNELSQSLSKDIAQIKKDLKSVNSGKTSKNEDKSNDKNVNSFLEKIQNTIIDFRKEQKQELNDLKILIKNFSTAKKSQKEESKKTEVKTEIKTDKDSDKHHAEDSEQNDKVIIHNGTDSNFAEFANEITSVIADLKQHVEFALDVVSTKLSLTNDLITTQFAHFDTSFSQIQTQLTNSFQQNTKGFSDVNTNIKATSQNILQAIDQINYVNGISPSTAFVNEILFAISDVIQHVEFAYNTISTKLSLTYDFIIEQFSQFDVHFKQILDQLANVFQQNEKRFSDVIAHITTASQNILQAISQINSISSSATVSVIISTIIAPIIAIISTATSNITSNVIQAITSLFQQFTASIDRIAEKKTNYIVDIIYDSADAIIFAINKSTKKTQKNSTENSTRLDRLQQYIGRMRNSIQHKVGAVNSLVNRWGKKHTKQIDRAGSGLFKRIFSGVGSLFKLILRPIGFLIGGIFGMMSIIFKPLTWILGFFKSPAMLLFLVGALIFLWPYISDFISGWWDDYIAPAFNWIFKQVSELWETISTAVSEWWTAKWAPYGGFDGFLTDVVWPKIQTFFTTVLWPFVTEKVWPFIKQHWKGILMAIGIFTFLKNPMAVFKMALQIPILILKSIQAAIAIVKIVCFAIKFISIITQGLVSAMPAIMAAWPYVLIPLLVAALVGGIVAAFSWFTEDSYEDLAEQQRLFKNQQDQMKANWEKDIKKWTKNDYTSRLESLQKSIDNVPKATRDMLKEQNVETVQDQRFETGINGMSATGAEIKDLMDKAFSTESLTQAAKDANGGKSVYAQSFADITSEVNENADKIAGTQFILASSKKAADNDEKGAIPQIELDRYNNLKLYLNLAIANLSHLFDYAQAVAADFAKDVANWSNDPETMQFRIAAFREWFSTAKDKSTNELIGHFKKALSHQRSYEVDRIWGSDYIQHTLGLNGDEGKQRFNEAAWAFDDVVANTRTELSEQLQKLLISPKLNADESKAVADSINNAILNADKEFNRVNEMLKTDSRNATGFSDKNLEQTIAEVNSRLGTDSEFAKANGYASISFAKERIEKLEQLKASAADSLYKVGLQKWNRSKGSIDDKYLTQLENALVSIGMTNGKNGVLSLEDKIKTYTAILANVRAEFDSTTDTDAKKRLEQIEQAMRKQLKEFNEEEKKKSGRDIMAENKANIFLKKKWYDLSDEERAKYGSIDDFAKQQNTVIQQNNVTNNINTNPPNTLQSVPGQNQPPRR